MPRRAFSIVSGVAILGLSLFPAPGRADVPAAQHRASVPPLADVQAFGDAGFFGSTNSFSFTQPIVGVAGTRSSHGYWEAAIDGSVYSYGDAGFHGSMGGVHLNQPIVGIAATPSGKGYWLVARDGGVFAFGDAHFFGSTGGTRLNQPVVGIASTKTGTGYWLAARDGGVFTFGHAIFWGSMGGSTQSIVGIAASPAGYGYWLADSRGGVFPFGWIRTVGGAVTAAVSKPIVAIASTRTGKGYWLAGRGTPGVLPGEVSVIDAGHSGGSGEIQLDWGAVPGATGYRIVRASAATGPFSFAADVNVTTGRTIVAAPVAFGTGIHTVTARITNIVSDRQNFYPGPPTPAGAVPSLHFHYVEEVFPIHYFRVTAYNGNGNGPTSVTVCGTPIGEPDC